MNALAEKTEQGEDSLALPAFQESALTLDQPLAHGPLTFDVDLVGGMRDAVDDDVGNRIGPSLSYQPAVLNCEQNIVELQRYRDSMISSSSLDCLASRLSGSQSSIMTRSHFA